MFKATPNNSQSTHKFIKSDSKMLNQVYGTDQVVPYWIADMEFPIAPAITAAMNSLIDRETYSYEFDSETVFSSISHWNYLRHQLTLEPANFVQVPGVLSAIGILIREFSEKGDGVLIQTPVYHQFRRLIESAGRTAVSNTLKVQNGRYEADFEDFENKLKQGDVKIVLLCNPHNPVGRVWQKAELEKLVTIAKKYQTLIISDEVHADIIFAGNEFTSITELGYDQSISIIGSPAKNFGLNSISNGYIYSDNTDIKDKVKASVSSMALDHGNAFTTYATIAAYQQGMPWFEAFLDYTQANRDWITEYLTVQLPQVKFYQPEGTNQIWLDFSGLQLDSTELKSLLTQKAKLALTPGTWFGESDENFYRLNFAAPLEQIQASFELLNSAISQLQN
ncbi:aminotransferase class I/II-fold pyridoxal phosphate-dependent enzyme [Shewanella sp. 10N.261.52.F9]|uniref:MalY/PatB family protein n=1 Tax=Shewanella TaxID=22 RepID=UPI00200CDC1F|nr:aminotransferase class I/II-fold pyridoxal phosphate-dependent enzyme [Shewanella marinintestina]MCL1147936.1 aminotransferase class I/II-fold pyridoxal phosphate-dependent enzyme [Shewanella marinintestina]